MYQITALFQDCEIAYTEGEQYRDVVDTLKESLQDSPYSCLDLADIDIIVVHPNGMKVNGKGDIFL